MNFLPRSLRWRTLLLTAVAMIACEVITFGLFAYFRNQFLPKRNSEVVASYVSLVRTALQTSPPEAVSRRLATSDMQIRLIKDPPLPPLRTQRIPVAVAKDDESGRASGGAPSASVATPTDRYNREIEPGSFFYWNGGRAFTTDLFDMLIRKYGFGTVRRTSPPNEALWIRLHRDNWWLMIPAKDFEATVPWTIIITIVGAVMLIALLAFLYVMQLSRPLQSLAAAASRFELGQRPQLPLTGPEEVRAVTRQFNAMAERLADNDIERHTMLAGLPHDLRAPLTRAKLRLALMDSPAERETREGFERDFSDVERIANQFVAYLRGLNGSQSNFEKTDMQALVRERVESWHGAGQNVDLERIDPCTIGVDRVAIERAMDNLISNALTHGAAPVSIRAVHEQDVYRIEADDHGAGIPPSLRAEALKPFARLDNARGSSGHCGLGLAVVQTVARLHGGRVELGEAPSGGLRAALILPLVLPQAA